MQIRETCLKYWPLLTPTCQDDVVFFQFQWKNALKRWLIDDCSIHHYRPAGWRWRASTSYISQRLHLTHIQQGPRYAISSWPSCVGVCLVLQRLVWRVGNRGGYLQGDKCGEGKPKQGRVATVYCAYWFLGHVLRWISSIWFMIYCWTVVIFFFFGWSVEGVLPCAWYVRVSMIVNEEKEEYNYYAMEKEKKSRWSLDWVLVEWWRRFLIYAWRRRSKSSFWQWMEWGGRRTKAESGVMQWCGG